MKTKEFIEKVETLGYRVDYTDCDFSIKLQNNKVVTYIWTERWEIDATYGSFEALPRSEKKELMAVVYEFMLTDPADRKEEKRYYLRKINISLLGEKGNRYFCKALVPNLQNCVDKDRSQTSKFQTIFSESEIVQMDITGFVNEEIHD